MKNIENKTIFEIRVRDHQTGEITLEFVTKEQICEGLEGKDMNLEDIGLALLNDLRKSLGMAAVAPNDEGKQLH